MNGKLPVYGGGAPVPQPRALVKDEARRYG